MNDTPKTQITDVAHPFEQLGTEQRTEVAKVVAEAIKSPHSPWKTRDFEKLCNGLAMALQAKPKAEPAVLFDEIHAVALSQHALREVIADVAAENADRFFRDALANAAAQKTGEVER